MTLESMFHEFVAMVRDADWLGIVAVFVGVFVASWFLGNVAGSYVGSGIYKQTRGAFA